MENKELKDFCQNLDKEKKIIEFKIGKKISKNSSIASLLNFEGQFIGLIVLGLVI